MEIRKASKIAVLTFVFAKRGGVEEGKYDLENFPKPLYAAVKY